MEEGVTHFNTPKIHGSFAPAGALRLSSHRVRQCTLSLSPGRTHHVAWREEWAFRIFPKRYNILIENARANINHASFLITYMSNGLNLLHPRKDVAERTCQRFWRALIWWYNDTWWYMMLDATKYFKIFMFLLLSLDKYISGAFTHPCVLMHTDMHNLSEWQSAVICYTSIESLEALPDPPSVGPCKDREHEQMNSNEIKGFKRQIWSFNSVHFVNLVQYLTTQQWVVQFRRLMRSIITLSAPLASASPLFNQRTSI